MLYFLLALLPLVWDVSAFLALSLPNKCYQSQWFVLVGLSRVLEKIVVGGSMCGVPCIENLPDNVSVKWRIMWTTTIQVKRACVESLIGNMEVRWHVPWAAVVHVNRAGGPLVNTIEYSKSSRILQGECFWKELL